MLLTSCKLCKKLRQVLETIPTISAKDRKKKTLGGGKNISHKCHKVVINNSIIVMKDSFKVTHEP